VRPPFWRTLKGNLVAGMRLFFVRPVNQRDFVSTFDQLAALLLITFAVGVVLDWQRAEAGASFNFDAVYSWATWLGLCVVLCALIARSLSPVADTRRMLVVAASVAPWIIVALWAIAKIPGFAGNRDLFSILTIAVVLPAAFRITRLSHGFMNATAFTLVLLGSLVIARADQYLYLDTRAWTQSDDDEDSNSSYDDWYASESLLFNEPERIAEAVEGLAPERAGVSDVYYVGFAGDGSQRVFRREALFGQQVFAERMGSGSRSIDLINDEDDRISNPLGTMSGLHYALRLIGQRMNPNEDVLVLLLTSHGSKEEGLAVGNGQLPLNNVEPEQVRRALDAAGIKWRIVIVSACYAGSFIEPLETANTLVITAADADHTSFGCADDRDLTYFGEAFLQDALPKATSLEGAFQVARAAIRKRERAEKLTPSNPQIFLGDAMREKLASLGRFPLVAPTAAASTTSTVSPLHSKQ
jgi:hypothetical protein